ncbi:MAG: hypothetical protein M0Z56_01895 [Desulfobacteraceae bacterium]|nr:hypothetical protein [Desulfobacteraceae bacterium]
MSPEMVLVVGLISIYMLLGPVVLLGLYILFDRIEKQKTLMTPKTETKDPALWTSDDVRYYLDHRH